MKKLIAFLYDSSSRLFSDKKNSFIFFVCVLISVFCWLLIKFTDTYRLRIVKKIEYVNLPVSKKTINRLPDSVVFEVSSNGFEAFKLSYFSENKTVKLNAALLKQNRDSLYYLSLKNSSREVAAQIGSSVEIISVFPDTVYFLFSAKNSKRVPVVSAVEFRLESNYKMADSVRVTPAFITLYGPDKLLKKINSVSTANVTHEKVNKNMDVKVQLMQLYAAVAYAPDCVLVSIDVDKYTESSVELPVNVYNLPAGYSVRVIPNKVKLKFMVGINRLEKINPSDFEAGVDYNQLKSGGQLVEVKLTRKPSFIKSPSLFPERVEYLLKKK